MTYEEEIKYLRRVVDRCYTGYVTSPIKKEILQHAIAALEKQIPQRAEYLKGAGIMFCPNCNSYLTGYKYCGECGQAVDIDNRREKQ